MVGKSALQHIIKTAIQSRVLVWFFTILVGYIVEDYDTSGEITFRNYNSTLDKLVFNISQYSLR